MTEEQMVMVRATVAPDTASTTTTEAQGEKA